MCALRESKVQGRKMIFSLLEAAHAEEKAMVRGITRGISGKCAVMERDVLGVA